MPRTKTSTRVGPGGTKRRLQLATRDSRSPSSLVVAPKVVIAADVTVNEACVPPCTAAAVALCEITDPIYRDVLEGALSQAFASLDGTFWEASVTLFCSLGLRVLLQSGLLKAIARVSLSFAQQAELTTYGGMPHGPNLQCVFRTELDTTMMQKYKRAIKEEEEMTRINEEVLGN